MYSQLNKRKVNKNENVKFLLLKNKYPTFSNFKSNTIINNYNRYSADSNKLRTFKYFSKYNDNVNSISIKNPPTTIDRLNSRNSSRYDKYKTKFFLLTNKRSKSNINSNSKINHQRTLIHIDKKKLFKNNSRENLNIKINAQLQNSIDVMKSKDTNMNIHNSRNFYKRIFPNESQNHFFKVKKINKIIKKRTVINKRIIPSFRYRTIRIPRYCDASTNTNYEPKVIENKPFQIIEKNKRPLMMDYFESQHEKLYHGFDKYKGRNKSKIPLFIVYKY